MTMSDETPTIEQCVRLLREAESAVLAYQAAVEKATGSYRHGGDDLEVLGALVGIDLTVSAEEAMATMLREGRSAYSPLSNDDGFQAFTDDLYETLDDLGLIRDEDEEG